MLGSDILDVGIGMAMLFLFVSLICSALREAIEAVLRSRAMDLERGIRELLYDPTGATITQTFFDHPAIYALFGGSYDPTKLKPMRFLPGAGSRLVMGAVARSKLPTYIPSSSFATAMLDIVLRGAVTPYPAQSNAVASIESLRQAVPALPNARLQRAVLSALDEAQGDLDRARANLEGWYNATMDRVSGWYKRRTQIVLLFIGGIAAVALNIDAVRVARQLSTDKTFREVVVARAKALTDPGAPLPGAAEGKGSQGSDTAPANTVDRAVDRIAEIRAAIDGAGYPIGWQASESGWPAPPQLNGCREKGTCTIGGIGMVLGWAITALAVTLGAPFWFDILNKFMVVRSTIKPAEKSGNEASKDSAPASNAAGAKAAPGRAAAPKPPAAAGAAVPAVALAAPPDPIGYVAQAWAGGDPEEGVI